MLCQKLGDSMTDTPGSRRISIFRAGTSGQREPLQCDLGSVSFARLSVLANKVRVRGDRADKYLTCIFFVEIGYQTLFKA